MLQERLETLNQGRWEANPTVKGNYSDFHHREPKLIAMEEEHILRLREAVTSSIRRIENGINLRNLL